MLKASFYTLGCRLNQYETKVIQDHLEQAGYEIVPFGEEADLGIINTCTVTREADAKCRNMIRKFIRKNPAGIMAVIGCYSQSGYKEIAAIPGVDVIIGNQDKMNVLNYIGTKKNEIPVIVRERISREDFTMSFVGDLPFENRANLKIQDGCDFMCSFCIIPYVRGRARSREFDNLMEEAKTLVQRGVGEIVLTGVNLGTYDSKERDILALVDELNAIDGLQRLRISSIEPTTIPTELFDRMADPNHALLPYLHIPLQAGSDNILKQMKRRYDLPAFMEFIEQAHATVPDICIGTDIMVGFPGESREDFEDTCKTFLNGPLSYCHVFSYSEREGTPAARRTDQVPVRERNRRCNELRRLSAKKRFDFMSGHLGKTVKVLFEKPREGRWPGYSENFIRVVVDSEEPLLNKECLVRLDSIAADYMEGQVIAKL